MKAFNAIPIGETFDHGGNLWRKRSTRTAEIIKSRGHNGTRWVIYTPTYAGQWFYFSKFEAVNRESHWWRSVQDYQTSNPA